MYKALTTDKGELSKCQYFLSQVVSNFNDEHSKCYTEKQSYKRLKGFCMRFSVRKRELGDFNLNFI